MKTEIEVNGRIYTAEEYSWIYIKPISIKEYKPCKLPTGERYSYINIYDENLKHIRYGDVYKIIGDIRIDYDLNKKMFRLFNPRGKVYVDFWSETIIGDLEGLKQ